MAKIAEICGAESNRLVTNKYTSDMLAKIETGRSIKMLVIDRDDCKKFSDGYFKTCQSGRLADDRMLQPVYNMLTNKKSIYFLFGIDPDSSRQAVYVGQVHGQFTWDRMNQHTNDEATEWKKQCDRLGMSFCAADVKEWWTEAVVFEKDTWTDVDCNYYEQAIYMQLYKAQQSGKMLDLIKNRQNPSSSYKDEIETSGLDSEVALDIVSIATLLMSYGKKELKYFRDTVNVHSNNKQKDSELKQTLEALRKINYTDNESMAKFITPEATADDIVNKLLDCMRQDAIDEYLMTFDESIRDKVEIDQQEFDKNFAKYLMNKKFLDIVLKDNCEFLIALHKKLMQLLKWTISNDFERSKYILDNMLFGLALDSQSANKTQDFLGKHTVIERTDEEEKIREVSNVYKINNYRQAIKDFSKGNQESLITDLFKRNGVFEGMKFSAVVGNPPYTDYIDLDFVNVACKVTDRYVAMIHPAKWYTAEPGTKTASEISVEQFRNSILPHMRYICFYPNCSDIFKIHDASGITWYIADMNKKYETTEVENKATNQKLIDSVENRKIEEYDGTLYNLGEAVLKEVRYKLGDSYKQFKPVYVDMSNKYAVVCSDIHSKERGVKGTYQAYGMISAETGEMSIVNQPHISKITNGDTENPLTTADKVVFTSNSLDACLSYCSFIMSKPARFLVALNISRRSPVFKDCVWKFVPEPPQNKFDHLFTDDELYKYFGISDENASKISKIIKTREATKEKKKKQ